MSQLRAEVAAWRLRAEVAEAQAAERERIIETQQMALRMLDAAPTAPPSSDTGPTVVQPASRPNGLFGLGRLLRF